MQVFLVTFWEVSIPVASIGLSVAFFFFSFLAIISLKKSGDLLKKGDVQSAGDALSKSGALFLNILKASVVLLVINVAVGFFAYNSYLEAMQKQNATVQKERRRSNTRLPQGMTFEAMDTATSENVLFDLIVPKTDNNMKLVVPNSRPDVYTDQNRAMSSCSCYYYWRSLEKDDMAQWKRSKEGRACMELMEVEGALDDCLVDVE